MTNRRRFLRRRRPTTSRPPEDTARRRRARGRCARRGGSCGSSARSATCGARRFVSRTWSRRGRAPDAPGARPASARGSRTGERLASRSGSRSPSGQPSSSPPGGSARRSRGPSRKSKPRRRSKTTAPRPRRSSPRRSPSRRRRRRVRPSRRRPRGRRRTARWRAARLRLRLAGSAVSRFCQDSAARMRVADRPSSRPRARRSCPRGRRDRQPTPSPARRRQPPNSTSPPPPRLPPTSPLRAPPRRRRRTARSRPGARAWIGGATHRHRRNRRGPVSADSPFGAGFDRREGSAAFAAFSPFRRPRPSGPVSRRARSVSVSASRRSNASRRVRERRPWQKHS